MKSFVLGLVFGFALVATPDVVRAQQAHAVCVLGSATPSLESYSQALACTFDGFSFDELQPRNFSFNSPYGACPTCDGRGVVITHEIQ